MEDERKYLLSDVSCPRWSHKTSDGALGRLSRSINSRLAKRNKETGSVFRSRDTQSAALAGVLGETDKRTRGVEEETAIMGAAKMADEETIQKSQQVAWNLTEIDGSVGVRREREHG